MPNSNSPIHEMGLPHSGVHAITAASTGVGPANQPDPSILGVLDATVVVSLAMFVFFAVVIWRGGVRAVTGALDRQIEGIRRQLNDAKALRAEAEALRESYARKMAEAEASAREMVSHAEQEAEQIVAQARTDADELVGRRARMAEDKIAVAEREALAAVRAKAADAATRAAATLLAARLDAEADKPMVDRAIAGLGRPN